jgi:KDO2-lipid IV(A) lauroyltransferase
MGRGPQTVRKRVVDWLVYAAMRIALCVVQALPIHACDCLAWFVAWIMCDVLRVRRNVTDENLAHAFPHWTTAKRLNITRRTWHHLALMLCEIAHVPRKIHLTNWRQHVNLVNKRVLVRYLIDVRPKLLVTGHFGNFEVAGYVAGMFGFPSFTVVRPLDNPHLDRYVSRFRQAKGQFILPKHGSAKQVEEVLSRGGTLSILGDQNAGPKGVWVEFLGRAASCHKAVALFTLAGAAPMLLSYARRTSGPMQFDVALDAVVDPQRLEAALAGVRPLTQWYNHRLERLIVQTPEQYWWIHRRWKGSPPVRRNRKTAAQPAAVPPEGEETRRVA